MIKYIILESLMMLAKGLLSPNKKVQNRKILPGCTCGRKFNTQALSYALFVDPSYFFASSINLGFSLLIDRY